MLVQDFFFDCSAFPFRCFYAQIENAHKNKLMDTHHPERATDHLNTK